MAQLHTRPITVFYRQQYTPPRAVDDAVAKPKDRST
jgi:hypothetical protein